MMKKKTQQTILSLLYLASSQILSSSSSSVVVSAQTSAPLASGEAVPSQLSIKKDDEHCRKDKDGSCLNGDSSSSDNGGDEYEDYNNQEEYKNEEETAIIDDEQQLLLDQLYSSLTTPIFATFYKTLERSHLRTLHPTALHETLVQSGNYTDGITSAGSPQWVGRGIGHAQIATSPTYTSFGSLLNVVTSGASAGRHDDILEWVSTLIHRRMLVQYHGKMYEDYDEYIKPCRVDLLDDNDVDEFEKQCVLGVEVEEYVGVVSDGNTSVEEGKEKKVWELERMESLLGSNVDKGEVVVSLEEVKKGKIFDTVIVNGLPISANDNSNNIHVGGKEEVDLKLENVVQHYLKPGGVLYVFGEGPLVVEDNDGSSGNENGPGEQVFGEILNLLDSVKSLSGVNPEKPPTASFIHRTITRLGLNVVTSTTFPTPHTLDDVTAYLVEAVEWIDEMDTQRVSLEMKRSYYQMCSDLLYKVENLKAEGYEEVYMGGYEYMIAAQLPENNNDDGLAVVPSTVDTPTPYTLKEQYQADRNPKVEQLQFPPLAPGVLDTYKWANGDAYDGLSARIGIPPQLKDTIIEYVKGLGIWDIILDTMKPENQMRPDSTQILRVASPYSGQNFTWSMKRPDNFQGSSSDMHWFDVADEAAHEEAIRALAKGGFDEVLNAIGTYLGLDNLVSFSIGILAVTRADKGYIHVDFSHSEQKAANFLVNLQTPGDEPELTVIEEDDVGNRRRAQVKYADEFGVMNGDDAMHATNECNHRASGGVRITASIFLSQLEEASLKQVAEHDKYYFPFGNMDWIWAQRGRHWNKDGTASMLNDKGRQPFEPVDAIEGCEYRIGENKDECMVHGEVRMNCYKTCGFFKDDGEYRPGEERKVVSADLPF